MKRLWISTILLLSVIGLCIYELVAIRDISEKSEKNISDMQQCVEKNDLEGALEISYQLNQLWQQNYTILTMFIHHDPLESIDQSLSVINTSILHSDDSNFWIESTRAAVQITKLSDTDIPSLGNIF